MERQHETIGKQDRPLREQSPEDTERSVRDKVARGVAAIAGALEGFVQEARKNDLPEKTKQALHQASETTRQAAETTREEGRKVKESIMGGGSSGGSSGGSEKSLSGETRIQGEKATLSRRGPGS